MKILLLIIGFYYVFRNHQICCFQLNLINLCLFYSIRTGKNGFELFYDKLPPTYVMLFVFKKLKLKNFFSIEEINELILHSQPYQLDKNFYENYL